MTRLRRLAAAAGVAAVLVAALARQFGLEAVPSVPILTSGSGAHAAAGASVAA